MGIQWKYGTSCSSCGGDFGKRRCRGMCTTCYDRWRKQQNPETMSKEVRRRVSVKTEWATASYLGFQPSERDWIRLAAFIDGEGSILLSPRRTPKAKTLTLCGKVVVTGTDARLAVWCADTFGMRFFVQGHSRNQRLVAQSRNWKDCYHSQACGYRAAWLLYNCLPWFLLKREQAEVVLLHQKTTKVGTWERGSGVTTPVNLLEYRMSLKTRLTELNKRGPRESGSATNPKAVNS